MGEVVIQKSYLYGYDNFEVTVTTDEVEPTMQIHGEQNLNEIITMFKAIGFDIVDER